MTFISSRASELISASNTKPKIVAALFFNSRKTVSLCALAIACVMGIGVSASIAAQQINFGGVPTIPLSLIGSVLCFDFISRMMPTSKVAAAVCASSYAILYLTFASLTGILFTYVTQRLGMPLRDDLFAEIDRGMGIDWDAFTHWVDRHDILARALRASYTTMSAQIVLAAFGLSLLGDSHAMRSYLLAFSLALVTTALTAALLPGLSPVALLDHSTYHRLDFSGATPLDHLAALRSPGIARIHGSMGGIVTFPSFHATIAVLTPLVLRRSWLALTILIPLDTMMLCATITEGAHYVCDTVAGGAIAFAALAIATWIEPKSAKMRSPQDSN